MKKGLNKFFLLIIGSILAIFLLSACTISTPNGKVVISTSGNTPAEGPTAPQVQPQPAPHVAMPQTKEEQIAVEQGKKPVNATSTAPSAAPGIQQLTKEQQLEAERTGKIPSSKK